MSLWKNRQRSRMIRQQLRDRKITDPRILKAFAEVNRESFVPPDLRHLAYADRPLEIGQGQTISQPYIVALTVDQLGLSPSDHVLDVGTGSGYAAAILARMVASVISIERLPALANSARERLRSEGFDNVTVVCGDGTQGFASEAPFDGIAVAAGGPKVPESLKQQLCIGGRLVIPVGDYGEQSLLRITRLSEETFREDALGKVRFVPLVGRQGWT